jgi:predicted house-cleaning noncanonical NTP pyrophosphatase (MazG superfamily)
LGRSTARKIKEEIQELPMATRREFARARERLQMATPICDEASLSKLEEEVAEYIREAKRRDPLQPNELISTLVDALARNYFRHELRKQAHMTPVRRRMRA